ncbi:peroxiredoxin [Bosea sp. BE271]|uniref:peroxiredoxin-like family protein n=1 Tax=Bosea TaxID=85413 RepID=UPI0028578640|nr:MULTISPECIES: peroxiredoxin-like family protein [Bosea]MDR6830737.1 peroxiredoxin [Bosea robiniae]MDR6895394.1 peroxiredoxin [Bosea sp. BE109]MDR7138790.1 peroxiredoxin [Bosea sp. BE168]MDR7175491.1 peroxiredoxin [Bosea sp. BE271]
MSLQEQLDAYRTQFESKAPAEALAVIRKATSDLVATGQAERALGEGSKAPRFELYGSSGAIVRSSELQAAGPVVISFYRGIWCPYCNLDLKALQATLPEISGTGASLVAISPQSVANGRKTVEDLGLSFRILSDPNNAIADLFGIRYRLPDELAGLYKNFGVNLPAINGDSSWTLPMPARFVVDRSGVIRYAEVCGDYTKRPDPSVLLPILRDLASRSE